MKIAEFQIRNERDLKTCARRVRSLAGLADLTRQQKTDLAKALSEVSLAFLAAGTTLRVELLVATRDGRQTIEAVIRCGDQDVAAGELGHLADLVDQFRAFAVDDGETVVRLGQKVPADGPPLQESDLVEWGLPLQTTLAEIDRPKDQRAKRASEEELAAAQHRADRLQRHLDLGAASLETLNMLSLVANKADNAVLMLDASGAVDWVNVAFEKLTGYRFEEIADTNPIEILSGEATLVESIRAIDDALRLGHGANEEMQLYRKDGVPFWTSLTLTPVMDETGEVTRWIAIGSDITRRHQAHDLLQKAKEAAEAASRTKSEFLANMSHEIRTPMNAIIGMTELALGTTLSTDQRDYLTTVKQSADALLELLNDILDLSKIEAGKMEIESIPFNLSELLTTTLSSLALRADVKDLELAWRLPPNVPSHLVSDPVRLRQIVINLVSNAIKFTQQGQVVVEIESPWENDDEASLHFAVADTGIGIPADRLERIFDAFEQADSSTTRQFGGTGLGLAICNKLVRLLGGRIWVQSQVGKGSTFHFSVRLKKSTEPLAPFEQADHSGLVNKSVLVVDDNATNRQILEEQLISWRMRVSLAEGADRAIKLLEAAVHSGHEFDVALIDAHMPDVDGFELARQIREHPDWRTCRVMMLTSSDQHHDLTRCRELGVDAYLVKPVSGSSLFDALLTAFGKPSVARSAVSVEPAAKPLRILVADDHEANRGLAAAILRKRGHEVSFAVNGREALDTIGRESFDLVLMDVQMPEMDGFQATAAVREQESTTQTHVPIIALTAHAMKGDREKCLTAGMDAYLPKPINARQLETLVESLAAAADPGFIALPSGVSFRLADPREDRQAGSLPHDFAAALDRLAGDEDILKSQMEFFLKDAPALLDQIRTSLASSDGTSLRIAAHRLKGLTASYDAHAAADLALQLEGLENEGSFEGAELLADELQRRVDDLRAAMQTYLG